MTINFLIILGLTIFVFVLAFFIVWRIGANRYLPNEQYGSVPWAVYNPPSTAPDSRLDIEYIQMMTLSFLTLRLNVYPSIVDSNHAFLLSFVHPDIFTDLKSILQDEAMKIKTNGTNSAFYLTEINVHPTNDRVDVCGVIKMWVGNGKPSLEIKNYQLYLNSVEGLTRIEGFYEMAYEN